MARSERENSPGDAETELKCQTEELPKFSPSHITIDTFNDLLARYPTTVETVIKRKETARAIKAATAREKKTRAKEKKPAADSAATQPTLTPDEKKYIDSQVRAYLALDGLRYGTLPERVRERATAAATEGKESKTNVGRYLEKDELVQLMEWKLKHGVYRPTLLGLVRSNQAALVRRTTASAFAAVPASADAEAESELDSAFPKQSLEALTAPLRGVGPATASLILSVATEAAPFYSDDVFLWLCLGVFPFAAAAAAQDGGETKGGASKRIRPNGELNVKYNLQEYRQLWEAVRRLRARLAAQSPEAVSCADVEKVAFVLRHYDASGHHVGDGPVSAQEAEETKRKPDQDVQAEEERSSKRRR
ncbi:hypothetical protein IFM51744_06510 [Aspergillus udagawae]|uniref:Uncharacterized protein n=1 Tax=Aspergillus udagawae TaxID=91492 RepID=A0A8H3S110_9EURO|nr:uncharacterized protein Aud_008598 [Aspergillus udagawae]GFF39228.1 hypothetical protein IFM46972_05812 [Aspergillus udagawae]GFF47189.1 hypothetical protein IFM51744_06510 [Aspergillus udagawae]GFF84267.1 hypothetical protein IFM53868_04088 [Aspergillus udagawae]GFG02005.1 hypothetical protein IFM5058_00719 [Aspergillus udagawae]GIC92141.1 hypothetical protein Aud_008598 [Aspergillus udagawae]